MKRIALLAGALFFAAYTTHAEYSWQKPHARVLPTGDLEWAPEPFVFEKGDSVRYIDFVGGSDANDGLGRDTAWKHHPGDPNATGTARAGAGIHTYIFKRGVIYRGKLVLRQSGTANSLVRLTSDPTWGQGEAVISGAERVTNWRKGAAHQDIPEAGEVWTADLSFTPRSVWVVAGDGKITRIPIARTPNWNVSDPEDVMSEWWTWQQPQWWTGKNKTTVKGRKMHLGVDRDHLTRSADYYQDAIVWTEWGIVMGTPFPTKVQAVDPAKKGLAFHGIWWGDSGKIITRNRYYLEDKPHYLDAAGEHWFEKQGAGGRLHLRLPNDAAPNTVRIEAARRYSLIEDTASAKAPNRLDVIGEAGRDRVNTAGLQHVVVSGLTFRFTNQWWNLEYPTWMHKEVNPAAIRLRGSCDHVRISHCRFEHVTQGIQIRPINDKTRLGSIRVTDNEMLSLDDAAITIAKGRLALRDAQVLRNRLHRIGLRPSRQSSAHALNVAFPVTMHIAGNILTRCYGAGIFVHGGKGGGGGEAPFVRNLIHHNKAEQTLLRANDWGGIETWQGGPFYLYCNISANPNGLWNWAARGDYNARLGYAYYLDGGSKNYLFNNIAWGLNNEQKSRLCNQAAFQEATPTIHNSYFNNTAYRFAKGANWSPRGGHHRYLGNLWSDISRMVFTLGKLKEDKSAHPTEYPHERMAFGRNVFHKIGEFGHFENLPPKDEKMHKDFASFQQALARRKAMDPSLGKMATTPLLRDPANRDLRPAEGSEAMGSGVKFFVPWALCGVVGEWNFQPLGNDPTVIPDEHWYMTEYYRNRNLYHSLPQYPLRVVNGPIDFNAAESYFQGPLENWGAGALRLNGADQYATCRHADLAKPLKYQATEGRGRNKRKVTKTASGAALKTADIHVTNFLIEIYFRTEPGKSGVLVRKMADRGYDLVVDGTGAVAFTVKGETEARLATKARVNDGQWHHLIAEADREAQTLTLYVDGKQDASGSGLGATSLSNEGDLLVGGTPKGECLAGAIEFLRISHGTLADAQTTIEELHAWQFDGPFLRDFRGKPRDWAKTAAGAIDHE